MDALKLLERWLKDAGSNSHPANDRGLPPDELRFVLEDTTAPALGPLRMRITQLLETDAFALTPLANHGDLARFVALRFVGIERTLPQRHLFAIGYALADALGLTSAEPDLGSSFFVDPEPPSIEPTIEAANVLSGLCWVEDAPPPDRRWALANGRFVDAWKLTRGAGIVVAQPDTGIAAHDEIDPSMIAREQSTDILGGDADPEDPLTASMSNPGHGTGTASVLASRGNAHLRGAAPEASVAPIRCIADVKVFDAAPIAAAIVHAVTSGCHVVSMSLGGVPSRALHAAICNAIAADLVVVAAAGNCVRMVVWPARYDEVIAVGGSNIHDEPWKGTSRGRTVDVCAPAELVWRAQRTKPGEPTSIVGGGQGTSFATALVAGAAALWLSHHTRAAVVAEAKRRRVSVQQLFRAALRATARRPIGWDANEFGAGIVDAQALLAMPLGEIPSPSSATHVGLLDDEMGSGITDRDFTWPRYETEVAAIALAQRKLGAEVRHLSPEAKAASTRPSAQLARDAAASSDARIRCFSEVAGITSASRPLALPPSVVDPRRLEHVLPKHIGLESAGRFDPARARTYLSQGGKREQLDRLEKLLPQQGGRELRSVLLRDVDEALTAMAVEGPMSASAQVGLEALVSLTGRPAIPFRKGRIDIDDPRASEWLAKIALVVSESAIQSYPASVGRIDVEGVHVGTGFVIGAGLILTNRHVLQHFASPVPRRSDPRRWMLTSDDVTIDFADTPTSMTTNTKFRIKSVLGAGALAIDDYTIDFRALDAAVIGVETTNDAKTPLPKALPMHEAVTPLDAHQDVYVVGYPARPSSLPLDAGGQLNAEVVRRLSELFRGEYGTKYISPGEVVKAVGSIAGDERRWVVSHDATTLGGSSGSCVIGAKDGALGVAGLHFAGHWMRANYAHALGLARKDIDAWSAGNPPTWLA